MVRPPASILIPHWMSQNIERKRVQFKDTTSVLGEFPYSRNEIRLFLKNHTVDVEPLSGETQVVVVGQECPQHDLRKIKSMLIESAYTSPLLYSQEMFLGFLLTAKDPLEENESELNRFVQNYPSFQLLMDPEFEWPTTDPPSGTGDSQLELEVPSTGFLAWLGYHVGQSGKTQHERSPILQQAFERESIPLHFTESYRRIWGDARSAKRLKRIADSIASFSRTAQRRTDPQVAAIADWDSDLAWLKTKLYRGFRFRWPDPNDRR